jgi:hypothetical protein
VYLVLTAGPNSKIAKIDADRQGAFSSFLALSRADASILEISAQERCVAWRSFISLAVSFGVRTFNSDE